MKRLKKFILNAKEDDSIIILSVKDLISTYQRKMRRFLMGDDVACLEILKEWK